MNRTAGTPRATVLTPPGRGAVAVVAVAGDEAVTCVGACFFPADGKPLVEHPWGRLVYGHWGASDGEDMVVHLRAATEIEVHCHGGHHSIASVLGQLVAEGCRQVDWPTWLELQELNPIRVEARLALADAITLSAATILLDQFHGALAKELSRVLESLTQHNRLQACLQLEQLLSRCELGQHLVRPWQVVIAGPPNVGKSSLINALVGYHRSIVFETPGTTRDIVASHAVADGWALELSDTAGIHPTAEPLELAGIERAKLKLKSADLVVWVVSATDWPADRAADWPSLFQPQVNQSSDQIPARFLHVVNKVDCWQEIPRLPEEVLPTSALTGQGVAYLLSRIAECLVPEIPPAGVGVPFTARQEDLLRRLLSYCRQGKWNQAGDLLTAEVRGSC